jgi:hypothetical protein
LATPLTLPLESNPSRFGHEGSPRLVNVRAERRDIVDRTGKATYAHYAVPGLRNWAAAGNGGCRGLFVVDPSLLLGVMGTEVIQATPGAAVTSLGGLLGSKPCTFARNRAVPTEAVIVTGGLRRMVVSGALTTIDDPDLPPPHSVDSIGPFILYGTERGFSYSDINEADSIAALSAYEAEGKADNVVRLKVRRNEVWLFGTETIEIWSLTDDADDPFAKLQGAYVERGCIAPHSVIQVGETMVWIDDKCSVRQAQSYSSEVISSPAVSRAIKALADPSGVVADTFTDADHEYLRLTSPDWTWARCRNARTGEAFWHEEESQGMTRRKAVHTVSFAGLDICGHVSDGQLMYFDPDTRTDGDGRLLCNIFTGPLTQYPGEVEFNALYVDVIPGDAPNDPGNPVTDDPVILVRDSDDGGKSWANQRSLSTGRQGQYSKRVATHQLGTSGEDGRQFHLQWDAEACPGITGAAVDAVLIPS